MRVGEFDGRVGRKALRSVAGWTIAASLVLVAVFGPPLTGQSIPTLVELRHDILMIDREFESFSMPATTSSFQAGGLEDDIGRGSKSAAQRTALSRGLR